MVGQAIPYASRAIKNIQVITMSKLRTIIKGRIVTQM